MNSPANPPPADEAVSAVIAQDGRRGEALRRGDAAALAAVLSDDLTYIHSNGRLETKTEYVDALAEKSLRFERFITTDVNGSRITADVVVLRGKIDQRKYIDGQPGTAKLFFTSIWRRESGVWRMVGMQTAIIPAGS